MKGDYPYILDKSSKKFPCPQCGKRRFVKYIERVSKKHLIDKYGRCDREQNCGYHLSPYSDKNFLFEPLKPQLNQLEISPVSYVKPEIVKATLKQYSTNRFIQFLRNAFGEKKAIELINLYEIGTSRKWQGATIFWQKDYFGRYRTGKIILYNPISGKRIKSTSPPVGWVHSELKRKGILKDFNLKQCLFGEHLVSAYPFQKIAVVESEKTAIVMSVFLPKFIWLATGGAKNLDKERFLNLTGREVVLFPDLGQFENWKSATKTILNCKISISNLLEKKASEADKKEGFDLADYFLKTDNKNHFVINEFGYPQMWDS